MNEPRVQALNAYSLDPLPPKLLEGADRKAARDWECKNWGCEYGPCSSRLLWEWDGYLRNEFESKWAPPTKLFRKIGRRWPTLTFLLRYSSADSGFHGDCMVRGGVVEHHDETRLPWTSRTDW